MTALNIGRTVNTLNKNMFLFGQLVKRDFQKKYKRTALGMVWSVLSPLLTLLVMKLVFTNFFGRHTPHYTIYLLSGNIVMSYYREATKQGMSSLISNRKIIEKINIPKYLFLFSKNVSALVNFALTIVVYFVFCIFDHIHFGFHMLALIYPILCLVMLNLGVGMILSALYVFFRDIQYLYDVFLMLLQYVSAIFYTIDKFSPSMQRMFLINPVYDIIKYFRVVVINGNIPSPAFHLLLFGYASIFFIIGCVIYKKYNHQFIYYL